MKNDKFLISSGIKASLDNLESIKNTHSFWRNKLFAACESGTLTRADFQYIFCQYYKYSRDFTRYIAALMANCESDYYRSCLSMNLWEEGGGANPDERHAQMFRDFLQRTLGIRNLEEIQYDDHTLLFAQQYLDRCRYNGAPYGTAFLSMGTEGIVSRMYSILIKGMRAAGIADDDLRFFKLHVDCDDDHAEVLAEMMASYSDRQDWYNTCATAIDDALTLRGRFFDSLHERLWVRRLEPIAEDVRRGPALAATGADGRRMAGQVLDHQLATVPAGTRPTVQRRPDECLFFIASGEAEITVDGRLHRLHEGQHVAAPRWSEISIANSGSTNLHYLCVSDRNLAQRFGQFGRAGSAAEPPVAASTAVAPAPSSLRANA